MNPQKRVSVAAVIVTYNREALLQRCLQALLDQSRPLDEIIVIDNASEDGTREMLGSKFPQVTLMSLSENTGGSGGFACGMRLACQRGHDWIWAMDDDTIASPNALQILLEAQNDFAPVAKIGALQGLVQLPNGETDKCVNLIRRNLFSVLFRGMFKTPRSTGLVPVDLLAFVGCLLNAEAVKSAGFPDPSVFIYTDDARLGLAMKRLGFDSYLVTDAKILHQVAGTGKRSAPWRKYYIYRNVPMLMADFADVIGLGVAASGMIFMLWRAIGRSLMAFCSGDWVTARAVVWGTVDGLARDRSHQWRPGHLNRSRGQVSREQLDGRNCLNVDTPPDTSQPL
jgi:rhamnopyranosyl-N-acetylglucosaminyl-diphospho-decaprenol beta-1,3/1,4-galactofuranosyltransferase